MLVKKIASWTLEWWPHERQLALYALLARGELSFRATGDGFEICQLGAEFDRHFIVIRRSAKRISIEGLLSYLPVWGAH